MDLSVIIPTYRRPEKVAACCRSLAAQTLDPRRFEVLVGIDGPDTGESAGVGEALGSARVRSFSHDGPAATRNRLIAQATGEILLLLNDDVAPHPACLEMHMRAHERLGTSRSMVLGNAPWRRHEPDRLFDRLIRESSMIFFYNRMGDEHGRDHDWGFRHAWTLNLSVPRSLAISTPFDQTLGCPCYEDLEWAWRLTQNGVSLRYRPEAAVEHDHRYEPEQYLARERMLGREALRLERASPGCARALFGRSLRSAEEIAYSRAFVEHERRDIERLERAFLGLADLPAQSVGGEHAARILELLYQQHLPVKRWHWRKGLLEAVEATGL